MVLKPYTFEVMLNRAIHGVEAVHWTMMRSRRTPIWRIITKGKEKEVDYRKQQATRLIGVLVLLDPSWGAPRWLKMAQDGSIWLLTCFKRPQCRPKTAPRGQRASQGGPQEANILQTLKENH